MRYDKQGGLTMTNKELLQTIHSEIELRIQKHTGKYGCDEAANELDDFLSFLDTLQVDESKDVDDAAETKYPERWKKYPNDGIIRSEEYYDLNAEKRDAFKAGAEWMVNQGETKEGKVLVDMRTGDLCIRAYVEDGKYNFNEDVIVQIRKKENQL